MLARDGHAVDAAISANAVLGLVEPYMNGMGGDLFAVVYEAGAATPSTGSTQCRSAASRARHPHGSGP